MKKVLFIIGTRPEAIKLAPMIRVFKNAGFFDVKVCVTSQHRQLLDQVLSFFSIQPDYDLNLMQPNQTLSQLTANSIVGLDKIYQELKPDLIVVQGDTTTVFAAATTAFYHKIKIAHIEAGLRTNDKYSPYPEEMNRILTSRLVDFHLAPTNSAKQNLEKEGIKENVFITGNTVVDALKLGLKIIENEESDYVRYFSSIDFSKRILLVTCHRRELFGEGFDEVCDAFIEIVSQHKDVQLVYPVHLNPNIRDKAYARLKHPSIILTEPLSYDKLIWLMNKSYFILTDSGGIQEEAPSLGKPVLVMRNVTERIEGIEAGTAKLIGIAKKKIVEEANFLLIDYSAYQSMTGIENPYGDGKASEYIFQILKTALI